MALTQQEERENYIPDEQNTEPTGSALGGAVMEPTDEVVDQGDSPVTGRTARDETTKLSDQNAELQQGLDQQEGILGNTLENIAGYENTTDTSYEGTDSSALQEGASIKEGGSFITPEATVSGQLEQLLSSDSAYMQQAKSQAEEYAASHGLLGSSMAAGASQRAAIQSALPIAEKDAATFASAQLAEQKVYNEISSKWGESELSAAARNHVYDIDTAKAETNASFQSIMEVAKNQGNTAMQTTLAEIQGQWEIESQTALKTLDGQLAMLQQQQQIDGALAAQTSQQASQIMAAAYGTINELMQNADFMAGFKDDPSKMTQSFNNFINMAKQNVKFIGATAGQAGEYANWTGYLTGWTTDLSGYTPAE